MNVLRFGLRGNLLVVTHSLFSAICFGSGFGGQPLFVWLLTHRELQTQLLCLFCKSMMINDPTHTHTQRCIHLLQHVLCEGEDAAVQWLQMSRGRNVLQEEVPEL